MLLLWSVLAMFMLAGPAYGIRLTGVVPLFEIRDGLFAPSDVSVSKDGLIYVVDGANHRIMIFDRDGKNATSFGTKGHGPGQFQSPLGIHVDSSRRVYVADAGNHRVQVFGPRGEFLAEIGLPPKNNRPADPTDVVVDESRNRSYVVDNDNHRILVYNLSPLELIRTDGAPGTGKLEFRYPFFMTLDSENHLYIVDVINTRIQVLDPDGRFVTFVGDWGVERGEFFRPKGVAIDPHNRIYVSDSYMGVIQVFSSTGEFHSVLGDPSKGVVKKFDTPCGIFVDSDYRLYVVEMFAHKVSVYSIQSQGDPD